jgi:hypothetical protein
MFTSEGISNIILCFITLANSSESPYRFYALYFVKPVKDLQLNPQHQIQKLQQKSYLFLYVLHYVSYGKNNQQSTHQGFAHKGRDNFSAGVSEFDVEDLVVDLLLV